MVDLVLFNVVLLVLCFIKDFRNNPRSDGRRNADPEYRRGRGLNSNYNDPYRRERSRDRFDQGRTNVPSQHTMLRPQYDTRQPNPPLSTYNQNPMGNAGQMLPPPPPPPPPSRYPQGMQMPPLHQQPPPQIVSQQMGGVPPSPYGPSSQFTNSSVQSTFNTVGMGSSAPPQGNLYGANNNPSVPPPIGGQQPPQSFVNPSINTSSIQNGFAQQSAVAQSGWQSAQQQNQPSGSAPNFQLPVDILGIADKAASAVQALQSQNGNHISPPPMQQTMYPGVPQVSAIPQIQAPQGYSSVPQPPNFSQGQKHGSRRRTIAQMHDLPVTVQYTIQVRFKI